MSSFKCSGCGRTDFFTPHGLRKHVAKCKGQRAATSLNSRKWAEDVKRRGFSGAPASIRVPAWEKVRGTEYDASKLRPSGVIADRNWTVYAYASDYNSRHKADGRPYIVSGSGRLTGKDLLKHARAVADHAEKQDASRFFEFFKVAEQADGRTLVVMLFGS